MSKSGTGGLIATIIAGFASIVPLARSCSKVDDVARVGKHMSHIDDVHDANRVGRYSRNAERIGEAANYSRSAGNYNKNPYKLVEAMQDLQVKRKLESEQLAYLKKEKPGFKEKFQKLNDDINLKNDRVKYTKAVDDLKSEFLTKKELIQFAKQVKRARLIYKIIKLYYPNSHDTAIQNKLYESPQVHQLDQVDDLNSCSVKIPSGFTELRSIQHRQVEYVWVDTVCSITLYSIPNAKDHYMWQFFRQNRDRNMNDYSSHPSPIVYNSTNPDEYTVYLRSGSRFGLIKPLPNNPKYWLEIESKDLTFIQEKAPQIFSDIVK